MSKLPSANTIERNKTDQFENANENSSGLHLINEGLENLINQKNVSVGYDDADAENLDRILQNSPNQANIKDQLSDAEFRKQFLEAQRIKAEGEFSEITNLGSNAVDPASIMSKSAPQWIANVARSGSAGWARNFISRLVNNDLTDGIQKVTGVDLRGALGVKDTELYGEMKTSIISDVTKGLSEVKQVTAQDAAKYVIGRLGKISTDNKIGFGKFKVRGLVVKEQNFLNMMGSFAGYAQTDKILDKVEKSLEKDGDDYILDPQMQKICEAIAAQCNISIDKLSTVQYLGKEAVLNLEKAAAAGVDRGVHVSSAKNTGATMGINAALKAATWANPLNAIKVLSNVGFAADSVVGENQSTEIIYESISSEVRAVYLEESGLDPETELTAQQQFEIKGLELAAVVGFMTKRAGEDASFARRGKLMNGDVVAVTASYLSRLAGFKSLDKMVDRIKGKVHGLGSLQQMDSLVQRLTNEVSQAQQAAVSETSIEDIQEGILSIKEKTNGKFKNLDAKVSEKVGSVFHPRNLLKSFKGLFKHLSINTISGEASGIMLAGAGASIININHGVYHDVATVSQAAWAGKEVELKGNYSGVQEIGQTYMKGWESAIKSAGEKFEVFKAEIAKLGLNTAQEANLLYLAQKGQAIGIKNLATLTVNNIQPKQEGSYDRIVAKFEGADGSSVASFSQARMPDGKLALVTAAHAFNDEIPAKIYVRNIENGGSVVLSPAQWESLSKDERANYGTLIIDKKASKGDMLVFTSKLPVDRAQTLPLFDVNKTFKPGTEISLRNSAFAELKDVKGVVDADGTMFISYDSLRTKFPGSALYKDGRGGILIVNEKTGQKINLGKGLSGTQVDGHPKIASAIKLEEKGVKIALNVIPQGFTPISDDAKTSPITPQQETTVIASAAPVPQEQVFTPAPKDVVYEAPKDVVFDQQPKSNINFNTQPDFVASNSLNSEKLVVNPTQVTQTEPVDSVVVKAEPQEIPAIKNKAIEPEPVAKVAQADPVVPAKVADTAKSNVVVPDTSTSKPVVIDTSKLPDNTKVTFTSPKLAQDLTITNTQSDKTSGAVFTNIDNGKSEVILKPLLGADANLVTPTVKANTVVPQPVTPPNGNLAAPNNSLVSPIAKISESNTVVQAVIPKITDASKQTFKPLEGVNLKNSGIDIKALTNQAAALDGAKIVTTPDISGYNQRQIENSQRALSLLNPSQKSDFRTNISEIKILNSDIDKIHDKYFDDYNNTAPEVRAKLLDLAGRTARIQEQLNQLYPNSNTNKETIAKLESEIDRLDAQKVPLKGQIKERTKGLTEKFRSDVSEKWTQIYKSEIENTSKYLPLKVMDPYGNAFIITDPKQAEEWIKAGKVRVLIKENDQEIRDNFVGFNEQRQGLIAKADKAETERDQILQKVVYDVSKLSDADKTRIGALTKIQVDSFAQLRNGGAITEPVIPTKPVTLPLDLINNGNKSFFAPFIGNNQSIKLSNGLFLDTNANKNQAAVPQVVLNQPQTATQAARVAEIAKSILEYDVNKTRGFDLPELGLLAQRGLTITQLNELKALEKEASNPGLTQEQKGLNYQKRANLLAIGLANQPGVVTDQNPSTASPILGNFAKENTIFLGTGKPGGTIEVDGKTYVIDKNNEVTLANGIKGRVLAPNEQLPKIDSSSLQPGTKINFSTIFANIQQADLKPSDYLKLAVVDAKYTVIGDENSRITIGDQKYKVATGARGQMYLVDSSGRVFEAKNTSVTQKESDGSTKEIPFNTALKNVIQNVTKVEYSSKALDDLPKFDALKPYIDGGKFISVDEAKTKISSIASNLKTEISAIAPDLDLDKVLNLANQSINTTRNVGGEKFAGALQASQELDQVLAKYSPEIRAQVKSRIVGAISDIGNAVLANKYGNINLGRSTRDFTLVKDGEITKSFSLADFIDSKDRNSTVLLNWANAYASRANSEKFGTNAGTNFSYDIKTGEISIKSIVEGARFGGYSAPLSSVSYLIDNPTLVTDQKRLESLEDSVRHVNRDMTYQERQSIYTEIATLRTSINEQRAQLEQQIKLADEARAKLGVEKKSGLEVKSYEKTNNLMLLFFNSSSSEKGVSLIDPNAPKLTDPDKIRTEEQVNQAGVMALNLLFNQALSAGSPGFGAISWSEKKGSNGEILGYEVRSAGKEPQIVTFKEANDYFSRLSSSKFQQELLAIQRNNGDPSKYIENEIRAYYKGTLKLTDAQIDPIIGKAKLAVLGQITLDHKTPGQNLTLALDAEQAKVLGLDPAKELKSNSFEATQKAAQESILKSIQLDASKAKVDAVLNFNPYGATAGDLDRLAKTLGDGKNVVHLDIKPIGQIAKETGRQVYVINGKEYVAGYNTTGRGSDGAVFASSLIPADHTVLLATVLDKDGNVIGSDVLRSAPRSPSDVSCPDNVQSLGGKSRVMRGGVEFECENGNCVPITSTEQVAKLFHLPNAADASKLQEFALKVSEDYKIQESVVRHVEKYTNVVSDMKKIAEAYIDPTKPENLKVVNEIAASNPELHQMLLVKTNAETIAKGTGSIPDYSIAIDQKSNNQLFIVPLPGLIAGGLSASTVDIARSSANLYFTRPLYDPKTGEWCNEMKIPLRFDEKRTTNFSIFAIKLIPSNTPPPTPEVPTVRQPTTPTAPTPISPRPPGPITGPTPINGTPPPTTILTQPTLANPLPSLNVPSPTITSATGGVTPAIFTPSSTGVLVGTGAPLSGTANLGSTIGSTFSPASTGTLINGALPPTTFIPTLPTGGFGVGAPGFTAPPIP